MYKFPSQKSLLFILRNMFFNDNIMKKKITDIVNFILNAQTLKIILCNILTE